MTIPPLTYLRFRGWHPVQVLAHNPDTHWYDPITGCSHARDEAVRVQLDRDVQCDEFVRHNRRKVTCSGYDGDDGRVPCNERATWQTKTADPKPLCERHAFDRPSWERSEVERIPGIQD